MVARGPRATCPGQLLQPHSLLNPDPSSTCAPHQPSDDHPSRPCPHTHTHSTVSSCSRPLETRPPFPALLNIPGARQPVSERQQPEPFSAPGTHSGEYRQALKPLSPVSKDLLVCLFACLFSLWRSPCSLSNSTSPSLPSYLFQ